MVFKINLTDFSDHVIAGSYKVNSEPIYTEWTDANGTAHREKIRDKVSGSFDMWYRTAEGYNGFVSTISENTRLNLTLPLTVLVNNTGETITGSFFLEHSTVRNRDGAWDDYMERFTVSITQA